MAEPITMMRSRTFAEHLELTPTIVLVRHNLQQVARDLEREIALPTVMAIR
jgi:hypothetical protein